MDYTAMKARLERHQKVLKSLKAQVARAAESNRYDFEPMLASIQEILNELENDSHPGKIFVALGKYKDLLTGLKRVLSMSQVARVSALSSRMQNPLKEISGYCQEAHVAAWNNPPAETTEYR